MRKADIVSFVIHMFAEMAGSFWLFPLCNHAIPEIWGLFEPEWIEKIEQQQQQYLPLLYHTVKTEIQQSKHGTETEQNLEHHTSN